MKIGICGYGVVGEALGQVFPDAVIFDKYKNLGSLEEINTCEIVFICVPTPMGSDGNADLTEVESLIGQITAPIIVIKSTVPPGTTDAMSQKYNKTVLFNPEFLTEANAKADMLAETRIVVGGQNKKAVQKVIDAYRGFFGDKVKYVATDAKTAEMVKYVSNSFLATKVAFCNQMYDACNALGIDYNAMRDIWLLDKRVGKTHTDISPERGFGGKCFPKDLCALIKRLEKEGLDLSILREVWNYNCKIRKEFEGKELTKSLD